MSVQVLRISRYCAVVGVVVCLHVLHICVVCVFHVACTSGVGRLSCGSIVEQRCTGESGKGLRRAPCVLFVAVRIDVRRTS